MFYRKVVNADHKLTITADDVERYRRYVAGAAEIPPRVRPYYVRWVDRFLRFRAQQEATLSEHRLIGAFSRDLKLEQPGWQVDQALAAIALFWRIGGYESAPSRPAAGESWEVAGAEFVRQLRVRGRSRQTEKTYLRWFRVFRARYMSIKPGELREGNVRAFLSALAVERQVAATTQRQAFNVLLFFYRHVLGRSIETLQTSVRAADRRRLPTVLFRDEIRRAPSERLWAGAHRHAVLHPHSQDTSSYDLKVHILPRGAPRLLRQP